MLAGERSNDLSLIISSETFNSLKYSGCTSWEREHFWSCGAPQNCVRGLVKRQAEQQLQSHQQVISFL